MLTKENNERLCRVGAGTPGNELFRSLWLPAVLSSQLPEGSRAGAAAPAGRRLDRVSRRQRPGRYHPCALPAPGRAAVFGKVEERGIRCSYHGWLYGRDGQCLEMPSEKNSTCARKCTCPPIRRRRRPASSGSTWAPGRRPSCRGFPGSTCRRSSAWPASGCRKPTGCRAPKARSTTRTYRRCTSRTRGWHRPRAPPPHRHTGPGAGRAGRGNVEWVMSIARRRADDSFYWRVTQWMAPMLSVIPSAAWPIGSRAWSSDRRREHLLLGFQPTCWTGSCRRRSGIRRARHFLFRPSIATARSSSTAAPSSTPGRRSAIGATITWSTGKRRRARPPRASMASTTRTAPCRKAWDASPTGPREKLISADLAIVMARRKVLDSHGQPGGAAEVPRAGGVRSMVFDGARRLRRPTRASWRDSPEEPGAIPAVPDAEARDGEQYPMNASGGAYRGQACRGSAASVCWSRSLDGEPHTAYALGALLPMSMSVTASAMKRRTKTNQDPAVPVVTVWRTG